MPYAAPDLRYYTAMWKDALPIRVIVVGQGPYRKGFFATLVAFSYDPPKTRYLCRMELPPSVGILLNDAFLV